MRNLSLAGQRVRRIRRAIQTPLAAVLLTSVTSCGYEAVSEDEVRTLGTDRAANQNRQETAEYTTRLITAFDEKTELTLGFVVRQDKCLGGAATNFLTQTGEDRYKISCSAIAMAYYTAPPDKLLTVLDGIGREGEREGAVIPFKQDSIRNNVLYYRNHKADASPEVERNALNGSSLTLRWDALFSDSAIPEPPACQPSDPPIHTCTRNPSGMTVAQLRKQGMVFELSMPWHQYHYVPR